MTELWEAAFVKNQLMWGHAQSRSALFAAEVFARAGAKDVLIPGVGYGRNAKAFLDRGMSVTGIEISATAIGLARSELGLTIPIHHGSVTDMPFDDRTYDGIFCYGLLYLLDAEARARVLRACHAQLASDGQMIFTLIAKEAPMYGKGQHLGEDWYEPHPGVRMYFYDEASIARDFGPLGRVEQSRIDEPAGSGTFPFINVTCKKG